MVWLRQQGVTPDFSLIGSKLRDHHCDVAVFLQLLKERAALLDDDPAVVVDFRKEMSRFLPSQLVSETVNSPAFWTFLVTHIRSLYLPVEQALSGNAPFPSFNM